MSISTIVSAFGPTVEIQYLKLFQKFRFSKWRFVGQLKYPRFRHTARVFIQFEKQDIVVWYLWYKEHPRIAIVEPSILPGNEYRRVFVIGGEKSDRGSPNQ